MTFTIKTDYGEFTGETMKEAVKAQKRGEKEQAEKGKREQELRRIARLHAESEAYHVLRFATEGRLKDISWRFYPTDCDKHYGFHVTVEQTYSGHHDTTVSVETENGKWTEQFFGYECLGAVMNGAGYYIVIFLRGSTTNEIYAITPSVYEGQNYHVELPKLMPDWFTHCKADAQEVMA